MSSAFINSSTPITQANLAPGSRMCEYGTSCHSSAHLPVLHAPTHDLHNYEPNETESALMLLAKCLRCLPSPPQYLDCSNSSSSACKSGGSSIVALHCTTGRCTTGWRCILALLLHERKPRAVGHKCAIVPAFIYSPPNQGLRTKPHAVQLPMNHTP